LLQFHIAKKVSERYASAEVRNPAASFKEAASQRRQIND
jgi:hypothetical protein